MMITDKVEMRWSNRNKAYYEKLGYIWKGDKIPFYVNVKDLPPQSNVKIDVNCDFCGKLITLKYYDYTRRNNKNNIHKDCCKECSSLKFKEVMMDKYGVESPMHLDYINKKASGLMKLDYEHVKTSIENRGYELLSTKYVDAHCKIEILCLKHNLKIETTWNNFQKSDSGGCPKCIKNLISGSNSHLWKGGITPLHNYLRSKIQPWKDESMKQCGFKCIITNETFDVIHHLYSFSNIISETMRNLKLPLYENIEKYSLIELKEIENECLRLHYKYGLGVCLNENLHKEFHSIYSHKEFTIGDFEEFVFNKTGEELHSLIKKEWLYAEKNI